jgi:hypothetical protein
LTAQIEGLKHTVEEQRLKQKFKMPLQLQEQATSDKDPTDKRIVRHHSQSFAFSHGLWLNAVPAIVAKTRLPTGYDPQTRLSTPAPDADTTAELTEHLPGACKNWVQSAETMRQVWITIYLVHLEWCSNLQIQVKHYMQAFRSHFQNNSRQNAAKLLSEFDDITTDNLNKIQNSDERKNCRAFQDLLGYTATTPSSTPSYPQISPLISRNRNPQLNDIFRADIISKVSIFTWIQVMRSVILQILIMILAGPNQIGRPVVELTPKCHARLWGIKTVTAGMIANAAIMVSKCSS